MPQEKNQDDDLSRIAYEVQTYQQQGQFVQQQLSAIQGTITEIGAALGTLRGLEMAKDNEVLLPIGSGTHLKAKLTDTQSVLLNIGSDIIAEKPVDEAIQILEERVKRLEATRDKLQEGLLELSKRIEQLDSDAKQILGKKGGKP